MKRAAGRKLSKPVVAAVLAEQPPPPAQADAGNFYRCPACGESVNGKDIDAVRLHHSHVLHPMFRSVFR